MARSPRTDRLKTGVFSLSLGEERGNVNVEWRIYLANLFCNHSNGKDEKNKFYWEIE
jgi:hypothetical protein